MTGYESKRSAAQAKVEGPIHVVCQCDKCKAQPAQEPVWDTFPSNKDVEDALRQKRLNQLTTPPITPKREWVGLTDEDKQIAFDDTQEASGGFWEFADAIEAKLKEKNT